MAAVPMPDHADHATTHLEKAIEVAEEFDPWIHIGAAAVHAVLHLADTIRHGLRDIVYEISD